MSSKTLPRTTCPPALCTGERTDPQTRPATRGRRSTGVMEPLSDSQASRELEHVHWMRTVARQRRQAPGRRKLDRYHQEIAALWKQGGSVRDIAIWLRIRKRTKVHASTVHRYLKRLAIE
ncbi:MAG: hypothetical protein ACREX4_15620 [Gammaproteobacteria bacterium]